MPARGEGQAGTIPKAPHQHLHLGAQVPRAPNVWRRMDEEPKIGPLRTQPLRGHFESLPALSRANGVTGQGIQETCQGTVLPSL